MTRRFRKIGTVLSAIITAFILTLVLMLVLRSSTLATVGFVVYLAIPLVVLIWSIITYIRQRKGLFLVYAITLTLSMIVFFVLLVFIIFMALKSFT